MKKPWRLVVPGSLVVLTVLLLSGCNSILPSISVPAIPTVTGIPPTFEPTTATITPEPPPTVDNGVYSGGPILINHDDEFLHANGVVSGTGASSDPYIIEGWTIDASTTDTTAWPYIKAGILIGQTTKYYIIRNCTIVNPTKSQTGMTGITAGNNGRVENCSVDNCYTGIYIGGSNTIITGNTVTGCDTGIGSGMYEQSNVTISKNTVSGCTDVGIDFNYLENSLSDGNTVTACYDGIRVRTVFNSTVSNNVINNNKGDGINVDSTFANANSTITGNQVSGSGYEGISVHCSNNIISNNTVTGNKGAGIFLDNVALISDTTSNNVVEGNTANNNNHDGIRVTCPHNTIKNNTATGNNAIKEFYADGTAWWYDIYIEYLQYNTLEGNTYGTISTLEYRP
jgi:parallel beta-helix repeat protein